MKIEPSKIIDEITDPANLAFLKAIERATTKLGTERGPSEAPARLRDAFNALAETP